MDKAGKGIREGKKKGEKAKGMKMRRRIEERRVLLEGWSNRRMMQIGGGGEIEKSGETSG